MYRIKTLNKISPAGLSVLDQTRYTISTDVENEDGILVRSADMHDYAFPDALRAVARAGAGTNNIPIDRCSEAGIVVFNTPGANANAVKELAAADHAERAAVRDGLRRVLEGLSREERRLFTLRFVYGLSSAELGGVLGLSPNGVDARVSRLRKKLKRLLARQGLGLWEREGTK